MGTPRDPNCGDMPYHNSAAMIADYFALVSLIPLIGLPFGMAACFLGTGELKTNRQLPAAKGWDLAWISIIVGGGTTALWLTVVIVAASRVTEFLQTLT